MIIGQKFTKKILDHDSPPKRPPPLFFLGKGTPFEICKFGRFLHEILMKSLHDFLTFFYVLIPVLRTFLEKVIYQIFIGVVES